MNETTKSKATWDNLEKTVRTGRGIDISCGPIRSRPMSTGSIAR